MANKTEQKTLGVVFLQVFVKCQKVETILLGEKNI